MAKLLPAGFQRSSLEKRVLDFKVQIITHTTQASIKTFSDTEGVTVYHEDDTRAVTSVDAAPGFALTDLDNDAAPAVLGFVIQTAEVSTAGDAVELIGVELVTNSIKSVSMTAPMTALGAVTFKGAAGASGKVTKAGTSGDPTGVTASGNLSFIASLTSLDIDEDAATTVNNEFSLRVTYLVRV
jgi:hypothetical protein